MLIDANALLADKQDMSTFTVAGSPWLSTSSYDLGVGGTIPQALGGGVGGNASAPTTATVDPGRGTIIELLLQITTAVTSAGAATVKFDLVMADNAALTTNLVVVTSTAAIAKATLVPGYQYRLRTLPQGLLKRFVGVQATVATADLTAGNFTAALLWSRQSDIEVGVG